MRRSCEGLEASYTGNSLVLNFWNSGHQQTEGADGRLWGMQLLTQMCSPCEDATLRVHLGFACYLTRNMYFGTRERLSRLSVAWSVFSLVSSNSIWANLHCGRSDLPEFLVHPLSLKHSYKVRGRSLGFFESIFHICCL